MVFSGHQPNFLPYMGVFYKMFRSDVFVLDDDVQYSNKGLHNKNSIIAGGHKCEIIVPVSYKFGDRINEVKISYNSAWDRKILRTIQCNYSKYPHFEEGYDLLQRHLQKKEEYLADLNIGLIKEIAERFKFQCRIIIASKDVPTALTNNARNLYQCKMVGCDVYYSGTGGHAYNDEYLFNESGVEIKYSDYESIEDNLSVIHYICKHGFEIPKVWKDKILD